MTEPQLSIPPAVRSYLTRLIELRFSGRDPRPALDALPASLPAGTVRALARGGAFGWMIDARLDAIDGRLALECLEDSRMAGPEHYRVWEDGLREELPNERTGYGHPAGASPEEIQRLEDGFYAHNRSVQTLLRERGFLGGSVDPDPGRA